jgi:hypothetical protein
VYICLCCQLRACRNGWGTSQDCEYVRCQTSTEQYRWSLLRRRSHHVVCPCTTLADSLLEQKRNVELAHGNMLKTQKDALCSLSSMSPVPALHAQAQGSLLHISPEA